RPYALELGMLLELGARNGGANAKGPAFFLDLPQLGDALDVDQQRRLEHISSHLHKQIGAPGKHASLAALSRKQCNRLVQRHRRLITHHQCPLVSVEDMPASHSPAASANPCPMTLARATKV